MDTLFIPSRDALADAARLMEEFGDEAGFEAAALADLSRDKGNVSRFCHWRQIERMIAVLAADLPEGTIH